MREMDVAKEREDREGLAVAGATARTADHHRKGMNRKQIPAGRMTGHNTKVKIHNLTESVEIDSATGNRLAEMRVVPEHEHLIDHPRRRAPITLKDKDGTLSRQGALASEKENMQGGELFQNQEWNP